MCWDVIGWDGVMGTGAKEKFYNHLERERESCPIKSQKDNLSLHMTILVILNKRRGSLGMVVLII